MLVLSVENLAEEKMSYRIAVCSTMARFAVLYLFNAQIRSWLVISNPFNSNAISRPKEKSSDQIEETQVQTPFANGPYIPDFFFC